MIVAGNIKWNLKFVELGEVFLIKKQKELEEINKYLSILANYIELQNSLGHFDINKHCENLFCDLLNIIYDLDLENLNKIKLNFPAVDLGDYSEGICIQVTSSNDRKKIVETVEKFIEKKLYKDFDELKIVILGSKKAYKKSEIDTQDKFQFDIKENVLDFKDLAREISYLRNKKIKKVLDFLKENVDMENQQPSYLANLKESKAKLPYNCLGYLEYLNIVDPIESKQIIDGIKLFINDFEQLDINTREIVYAIIVKSNIIDSSGIHFNYVELRKYLGIDERTLFDELRILYNKGYISSADDNGTEYEILEYWTNDGWEVFNDLVNYCESKNIKIKELILELNFELLD